MSSYSRFSPTEADRRPSERLLCAASSEKPSAGGDLDLGILSSICKDLELARRTSRISRQAVARVILLRGVLVTRDPGHLSRILKPQHGRSITGQVSVYLKCILACIWVPMGNRSIHRTDLSGSQKWVDWG